MFFKKFQKINRNIFRPCMVIYATVATLVSAFSQHSRTTMIKSSAYKLYLQCISDIYHYTIDIYFWGGLLQISEKYLENKFSRGTYWSTSMMARLFPIGSWKPRFSRSVYGLGPVSRIVRSNNLFIMSTEWLLSTSNVSPRCGSKFLDLGWRYGNLLPWEYKECLTNWYFSQWAYQV